MNEKPVASATTDALSAIRRALPQEAIPIYDFGVKLSTLIELARSKGVPAKTILTYLHFYTDLFTKQVKYDDAAAKQGATDT